MKESEQFDQVPTWLDLLPQEACECIAIHLTEGRPTMSGQNLARISTRQSQAIWNTLDEDIVIHLQSEYFTGHPDEIQTPPAALRWVDIFPKKHLQIAIFSESDRYDIRFDPYDYQDLLSKPCVQTVALRERNYTIEADLIDYNIKELHIEGDSFLPDFIRSARLRVDEDDKVKGMPLMQQLLLACSRSKDRIGGHVWQLYAKFPRCLKLLLNENPPFYYIPKLCQAESVDVRNLQPMVIGQFGTAIEKVWMPRSVWSMEDVRALRPCTALKRLEISVDTAAAENVRDLMGRLPVLKELRIQWVNVQEEEEEELKLNPGVMLSIIEEAKELNVLELVWGDEDVVVADLWNTDEWEQILVCMGPRLHELEHESRLNAGEYWNFVERVLVCLHHCCPNVERLELENRKMHQRDVGEDVPDWKQLDRIAALIRVLRKRRRGIQIEGFLRTIDVLTDPE